MRIDLEQLFKGNHNLMKNLSLQVSKEIDLFTVGPTTSLKRKYTEEERRLSGSRK